MQAVILAGGLGTRLGARLPPAKLRGMLAILVLSIAIKLAWGLFAKPDSLYSISIGGA